MNKKILSILCLSVFTIGSLTACSEETEVSSNSKYFDSNTGTWTNQPYANYKANREVLTSNSSDDSVQIARVEPNNDPKLMENPSAVNNVSENATRRNNPDIQDPIDVKQSEPYVDKPYINQIATANNYDSGYNSENVIDQTSENEEEQRREDNANRDIIYGLNQQLQGIDYNIERLSNMKDRDYSKEMKLLEYHRNLAIDQIAQYEKY